MLRMKNLEKLRVGGTRNHMELAITCRGLPRAVCIGIPPTSTPTRGTLCSETGSLMSRPTGTSARG